LLALGGYVVRRRRNRLDPGDAPLTPAQQFALGRQRAIMRQAPAMLKVGLAMIALGVVLFVVSAVR